MTSGRAEPRVTIGGLARLESSSEAAGGEVARIENISRHGARVLASRKWQAAENLILTWLGHAEPVEASVVYRQPTMDGRWALGLRFETALPSSITLPFHALRHG
jgi:hypothetical protein